MAVESRPRPWRRRVLAALQSPLAKHVLQSGPAKRANIAVCRRFEFRHKERIREIFGTTLGHPVVPPNVPWVDGVESIRLRANSQSDQMLHEVYVNRHYQNDVLVALRNLLSQGDVFWDVGANHGFMSLYVSRMFDNSVETLAFEPSPVVVPFLRQNVTENGASNVHVHALGLADRVGMAEFFYAEDVSWNSTLVAAFAEHHNLVKSVQVPVTTIDEAVRYLPPPTVLKIDVEGAESQTVAGGKRYLTEHHPPIIVEYNLVSITHAGMAPDEYLRMFRDMGYTPHVMDRPWFGWYRWDRLHPVTDARNLPELCNLILLGPK